MYYDESSVFQIQRRPLKPWQQDIIDRMIKTGPINLKFGDYLGKAGVLTIGPPLRTEEAHD